MKIDFFEANCQTITREKRFGICDDDDKNPAYIDLGNDENKWIATVKNDILKEITFRAIDNCITVLRDNGEMGSRCDVIMIYEENIAFVELKNKVSDWKSSGIDQIEATLIDFIKNNEQYYYSFKRKKAFIANRRHPNFHVIENEIMKMFFQKYKIRLDAQAEIIIR